ncbi:MAG: hypothetical protein FWG87_14000 [Defluviitaleaceae bacterium]|nr:hypothetical protein [Defluviitaleaceae bacterium]
MSNLTKKALAFILALLLLVPTASIFATEGNPSTENNPSTETTLSAETPLPTTDPDPTNDDILVLTLDEALSMVLHDMLAMRDLNLAIRDVEIVYRDVEDIVKRLGTGDFQLRTRIEIRDAIAEVEDGMRTVNAIFGTQIAANMQSVTNALSSAAMGQDPDANAPLVGMAMSQAMTGSGMLMSQTATLDTIHTNLTAQLRNWDDREFVEDFRTSTTQGMNQVKRQVQSLRLNQELISIAMQSALRNILVGIHELEMGITLMEANLELAEINIRRMTVAHSVGMISTHDLRVMQHGLAQGKVQLADLERALASLRQNLNQMLGQPLEKNILVEYERGFEIPEDFDIDALILGSPSIRQLQFDVDFAKAQRRAETGNNNDIIITAYQQSIAFGPNADSEDEKVIEIRERAALQEAVERAVTAYEQGIRSLDAAIRQMLTNANALDAQEEAQLGTLEQAAAALSVAESNFAAGRVTRFDVEQARVAVLVAEQGIESIVNKRWVLGFELGNPVLSGGAGA